MVRVKRLEEMLKYIETNGSVSLDELCEVFQISKNTARRDIDEVLKTGTIKKIYGGVSFITPEIKEPPRTSYSLRSADNMAEKRAIARLAAEQIEDGDSIFVDAGTTTGSLVEFIKDKKELTVVTNNLDFIIQALPYKNIRIIVFGGILERDIMSFSAVDEIGAEMLKNYNFKKGFFSATGVTVEYGAMNSRLAETACKSTAANWAQIRYLLVDHSKFGRVTIKSYAPLNTFDYLITDRLPDKEITGAYQDDRHKILIAGRSE